MEITTFTQTSSSSRLLDAFEKLGVSSGAELSSQGSLGKPPKEIVDEFERLLNSPSKLDFDSSKVNNEGSSFNVANDTTYMQSDMIGSLEDVKSVSYDSPPNQVESASQIDFHKDDINEIEQLMTKISSGEMNPSELYRLQYLVNMLNIHSKVGQSTSNSMVQNMEQVLKQQG